MSEFLNDLSQGLGLFNQGVQQLATQRAVAQANDQVQAIRDSGIAEDEKQQQFRNLAQNLTLQMTANGASAAHIQNIAQAFAPKEPTLQTPEEAVLMGNEAQKKAGQNLINEKRKFEASESKKKLDASLENAAAKGVVAKQKAEDKGFEALSQALDPNKARGGQLAKSQEVLNRINRLEGLFQQFPDNNFPKAQSVELATGLAAIYAGGSPQSQDQIRSLVPQGSKAEAADVKSWFLNEPQGQQQQKAIQILKDSSQREKDIVQNAIKQAQLQRVPAFQSLKDANPVKFESVMNGFGLSSNEKSAASKTMGQQGSEPSSQPMMQSPSAQFSPQQYWIKPQ